LAIAVQKLTVDDNAVAVPSSGRFRNVKSPNAIPPSSQSNSVFINEISGKSTAAADVIGAAVIAIARAKCRGRHNNALVEGFGPLLIPHID
jgi:hypothetical protein